MEDNNRNLPFQGDPRRHFYLIFLVIFFSNRAWNFWLLHWNKTKIGLLKRMKISWENEEDKNITIFHRTFSSSIFWGFFLLISSQIDFSNWFLYFFFPPHFLSLDRSMWIVKMLKLRLVFFIFNLSIILLHFLLSIY